MKGREYFSALILFVGVGFAQGASLRLFGELYNFPLKSNPYFAKGVSAMFKADVIMDPNLLEGSGKTCTTMGNLVCEEPIYCTGTGSIDCLDKCPGSAEDFKKFTDVMQDPDFYIKYPALNEEMQKAKKKGNEEEQKEKQKALFKHLLENCGHYPPDLITLIRLALDGPGSIGESDSPLQKVEDEALSGFGDVSYDYYDDDEEVDTSENNQQQKDKIDMNMTSETTTVTDKSTTTTTTTKTATTTKTTSTPTTSSTSTTSTKSSSTTTAVTSSISTDVSTTTTVGSSVSTEDPITTTANISETPRVGKKVDQKSKNDNDISENSVSFKGNSKLELRIPRVASSNETIETQEIDEEEGDKNNNRKKRSFTKQGQKEEVAYLRQDGKIRKKTMNFIKLMKDTVTILNHLDAAKTDPKRSDDLQNIFEEIHRLKREIGEPMTDKMMGGDGYCVVKNLTCGRLPSRANCTGMGIGVCGFNGDLLSYIVSPQVVLVVFFTLVILASLVVFSAYYLYKRHTTAQVVPIAVAPADPISEEPIKNGTAHQPENLNQF